MYDNLKEKQVDDEIIRLENENKARELYNKILDFTFWSDNLGELAVRNLHIEAVLLHHFGAIDSIYEYIEERKDL